MSRLDVSVKVQITALRVVRLDLQKEGTETSEAAVAGAPIKFDVSARLEEKERRSGEITVLFALDVGTKPSVVKFEVEGYASMTGKDDALVKMLEVDPKTGAPFVFDRIYQHLFTVTYVVADLMGTVYPPPDLLFMNKHPTSSDSTVTEMKAPPPAQQVAEGSSKEEAKTVSA